MLLFISAVALTCSNIVYILQEVSPLCVSFFPLAATRIPGLRGFPFPYIEFCIFSAFRSELIILWALAPCLASLSLRVTLISVSFFCSVFLSAASARCNTHHPLIAFLSVVFPLLCRFVVTHTNSLDSILLWLFWIASLCIAETPSVWWCCIQQISSYIICKDLGPSNSNPRHENYMTIYWTSKIDYEVCDVASNLCGGTLCLFDFNVRTYFHMWRYARCTATRMRPDILRSLLWVTILEKPLL